jgi:CRISPR/Cas system endoribonuclease Cas6 (RAMP superfamily)
LSFAKGIGWTIEKQIEVKFTSSPKPSWISLKGNKVLAFEVSFASNVFLPAYMGLGKSVSMGFGVVKSVRNFN